MTAMDGAIPALRLGIESMLIVRDAYARIRGDEVRKNFNDVIGIFYEIIDGLQAENPPAVDDGA